MQTTLATPSTLSGIGLHSGEPARATLRPAPAGTGIVFRRTDLRGRDALVPALWDRVAPSPLCTRVVNGTGAGVATVEHLMAALAGLGIHNARIDVDGPEVPILDGSARPWADAIRRAGIARGPAPLLAWEVLEPVEVRDGEAVARLDPAPGLEIDFGIDFPDAAIGRQRLALALGGDAFLRELSDSRTFCRQADVAGMRARGLARGGSLRNAVVVDGDRVLTPGGLRHPDEFVRHKMLDALGDLATAGRPILGRYTGRRAGHALTNRLLRAMFARPSSVRAVPCDAAVLARLPGLGRAGMAELPAVA